MATATGNDRTQRPEPRRGDTPGQEGTSRQASGGSTPGAQGGGLARSGERGLGDRAASQRGLGFGGYGATSPFGMMRRFMEDMDRMFESFGPFGAGLSRQGGGAGLPQLGGGMGLWQPQIEVFEREGNVVVRADLPGVPRDAVQLRLDDDVLIVSGERRDERKEEREGWYHSERSYGSFQRAIQLPQGVDPDRVQASFEDGVLEVTVPVPQQKARGRNIAIGEPKGGGAKALGDKTAGGGVATGDASSKIRGMS
jgi:HSP20 family protein